MKIAYCPCILLLICGDMGLGAPVYSIICGDVCSAEVGSPYMMSCSWTGSLTTGIVWSRGTDNILTCNTAGLCVATDSTYATGNFTNATSSLLTISSFNPSTDAGRWTCQDSSDVAQNCTLPHQAIGTLQGNCTENGGKYDLTCSGLTDHGTPAVELQIKLDGDILEKTTTGGSVSSTGEAGKSYTCEVSGDAPCLVTKSESFSCQEATTATPTSTATTPTSSTATTPSTARTTDAPEKIRIDIILGCVGGGVVIAIIIIIFCCCCPSCCHGCCPSCCHSCCPSCCCRESTRKRKDNDGEIRSVTGGENGHTKTTLAKQETQVVMNDYPTSQKTEGDDLEKRMGGVDSEDITITIPDGQSDGMKDDRVPKPDGRSEGGMHRL